MIMASTCLYGGVVRNSLATDNISYCGHCVQSFSTENLYELWKDKAKMCPLSVIPIVFSENLDKIECTLKLLTLKIIIK